ncbi:MAG: hypothetical protein JXQ65_14310 [Candidatus Marinimicrobia bacterium]|nr:hypothetical protein [Candidatus Neomarinimicrobiota bacterium]
MKKILLIIGLISVVFAQEKTGKKIIKYSGNIGARFESNVSDLDYLPENYAATYFNFNLSAGLVGFNLNGELTTSESRFSPEFIKNLSFSPKLGWFQLYLGDHYPNYSKLVMSGAKVRGVSVEMNPEVFFLGMTGGRVRVGGADKDGEYRREAYGLQLGARSKEFELLAKISRLNDLPSADMDSIYKPQESLTAGVSTAIEFPGKIRIKGEAGYSFSTLDKTTARVDSVLAFDVLSLDEIGIQPRLSSRLDYAYNYNIFIPIKVFQFTYQRDFIGPGFQTLGTPYLKNDILKDMYRAGLNLFKGKFNSYFIYLTQKNNLNDELTRETKMDHYTVSTQLRPVRFFSISGRFSTLERVKKDSVNAYEYLKDSYDLTPELRFKTGPVENRLSFGYSTSVSDYNNSEFTTQNIRVRYHGNLESGYSIFGDLNYNDYEKEQRNSYSIGAAKRFKQRGNLSASLGLGDKMESNVSAYWVLPWKMQLNTSLSYFRLIKFRFRYQINISRNF